ncbi:ATP-binding protein [Duganella sp.]|uniref:hybrid sensor histidine kinase/response regulator n=1 Tax=Duganella sp. TaxID=1904440 RepID=UPI0031DBDB24
MRRVGLYWRDWSLTVKGVIIVVAALATLVGSAATSYKLERQTAEAMAEMQRTLKVQRDIQLLHALIAEAATGVRGYLLTGVDDFLNPYRAAQEKLPAAMADLQHNVRDAEQLARLSVLLPLVRQKLIGLEALRQQYDASPDALRASLLSGRQILNQLRDGIGAMNAREALLVEQRTATLQEALRRNVLMNLATIVIGLAGALAMLLFTLRVVRRVRLSAENAERLVNDQPLLPTGVASDELGVLADRLHHASVLLARRAAEAQAASVAKSEFLSRTSHELRTPLNAILGFAQLLEDDLGARRGRQHAEHITRAGKHLLSLIDDVLDVARVEAGQLAIAAVPVTVAPVLNEAIALLKPLAARHQIKLRPQDGNDGHAVLADRQRLLQIVLNLLSNAIKYNRAGGEVRIGISLQDGQVAIAIADDGDGIAAGMQERLFTPFDRLGAERGKTEGVGLGLAVSRSLAEAMGGSLAADSRAGQGSVFTLRLPRAAQAAQELTSAPGAPTPEAVAAPVEMPTLLCIDSDASSLALMETLMARRPGWRFVAARSVADGWALAASCVPDVVLLDAHLADPATLTRWRDDTLLSAVPLVLLGGDGAAPAAGGHLKKPLDLREFFALLDRITK